jgi:hypothetical protein
MRCVHWDGIARIARCALPIVLVLAAASSVAAQSTVCHTIRRGESADQVARRLTGDSWNAYRTWFEIRNSASRPVPKSQYNRVRAGWQACLTRPARLAVATLNRHAASEGRDAADVSPAAAIAGASASAVVIAPAVLVTTRDAATSRTESSIPAIGDFHGILRTLGRLEVMVFSLGVALIVPWVGWRVVDDRLARARTATIVMRHFATRFVHEFERPLVWAGERPLRSRVRYSARRGRLDILLAPGAGRRYPNLSDHKKNVEYDIVRVVNALGDASFVNGPPYIQAGWIVVPFQFKTGPRQSGVTCISSL